MWKPSLCYYCMLLALRAVVPIIYFAVPCSKLLPILLKHINLAR